MGEVNKKDIADLTVEDKRRISQLYAKGEQILTISFSTGISAETVRRYLRSTGKKV